MTSTTLPPVPPAPNGPTDEEFRERFDEISRDFSRYRLSRDSWTMIVFALAAFAAIFSIVGMGLALRTGGGETAGPAITAELTEFAVTVSTPQIEAHPMHLHAFEQLVIAKDGESLDAPVRRGHHPHRPGRALHRADPRRHCRDVGVALSHPQPRRVGRRHVRHGHRIGRAMSRYGRNLYPWSNSPRHDGSSHR